MLDAGIPLGFQPTQKLEDPMQAQARVLDIRNAQQRNVLGQQQIQAAQLENKKRQSDLDAESALSELVSKNTQTGEDGVPRVNRAAVLKGLADRGHADRGAKWDAEQRANETASITNAKNQLANIQEQVKAAGQLLGPLAMAPDDTPPEQLQGMYRDAHQRALALKLIQPGQEPDQLPVGPDGRPDLRGVRAHFQSTLNADQQLQQHNRQLDYALKVQNDAPKEAKDWRDLALGMASNSNNDDDLQGTYNYLRNNHAPESVLALIPKKWTPDVKKLGMNVEQAQKLPGEEAKTESEQAANFSRRLEGATTYGEYNSLRNGAAGVPDSIRKQYPDFSSNDPSQPISDDDRTQMRHLGMTPAQSQGTDLRQSAIDAAAERAQKKVAETATAHKATISKLADQAIAESNSSGGRGVDDALKNVMNTDFYQNHPIGESRGEVITELQRRKVAGPGGLDEQRKQNLVDNKDKLTGLERLQWMKDHPGQPVPTRAELQKQPAGGQQTHQPPPAQQRAPQQPAAPAAASQPPAASPAAPAKTYTEADIRAWAKRRGSDPEVAVSAARAKKLIP